MRLTLRTRLAAIAAVVFGLLLAALSIASYQVLKRWLDADATERLVQVTDGLHGYLRVGGDTASVEFDASDSDQAAFVHEATRYYRVYDLGTGRLLATSSGFAANRPRADRRTGSSIVRPPRNPRRRVRQRPTADLQQRPDGARPRGVLLQVGASLAPTDAALVRVRDVMLWAVPGTLLAAVLAAWWLSGFALLPLTQMAAAAREIDVTTLDRRVPVRGTADELDRVARAFNETLDRLERAVGEMRQFSAALAHELRTPLAALRGEIELALRAPDTNDPQQRAFASQIEEIDRLTRLIDHILTLARAESGQIPITFARVDLGALAASLVDQLGPVAQARSIALRCERAAGVVVDGDAGWLSRLLLNLLGNALKFTHEHGRVLVRVSRQGGSARIDVQDTGIGLSTEDARQVFGRFFRADRSRSSNPDGAGLGLTLVQWIGERHQGAVAVESRLGEGSTFTVTLPFSRN